MHREGRTIRAGVHPNEYDNWWHLIVSMISAGAASTPEIEMVSLSEFFRVDAGCATGAATRWRMNSVEDRFLLTQTYHDRTNRPLHLSLGHDRSPIPQEKYALPYWAGNRQFVLGS